ncbi:MAG: SapC family protein [Rhodobacteraceae bacterium]|nr:SapC family protein [Paracoccaceae bacterium]
MTENWQLRTFLRHVGDRFEPLSPERHGSVYWKRHTSFAFAAAYRSAPVVLDEIDRVGASMPILFETQGGAPMPCAVMQAGNGPGSDVVSDAGAWQVAYVPACLRMHPFALCPDRAGDGVRLLLDPDSPWISHSPADLPLYDHTGALAADLARVTEFFGGYRRSWLATRDAAQALSDAGILKPAPQVLRFRDVDFTGYHAVDRAALNGLAPQKLADLMRQDALRLAFLHLGSLHKLEHIAQIGQARAQAAPRGAPATPEKAARTDAFLEALAQSGDSDADYFVEKDART